MSLFQQSVQDKYIKNLDSKAVQQAWQTFTAYFHNAAIQQNIRDSKEEEFQEGFLRELFVNVLGYTLKPHANFNLTTEYKNVKDAKKADGAIIINNEPVGVIELKGTNTTDLTKVEPQAFGYKNNHPKVTYIVIANFEKLNFYIDTTLDPLTFNLFTLGFDDFKLLYLCLAYSHIAANLPKKIKDESLTQEDKVTKQLYADYAAFKTALFDNIRTNNPTFDALVLYKSTQKLLDRLLFIFFAEDRNLLPPNSIRRIIAQWQKLAELDEPTPLYSRLVKYFGYMNTGFKGKEHDIFAYNGGLFLPDAVLDNIVVDDEVLHTYTIKLSDYNYQTEVDVNILGHIFENSLNDLDEVKATLEGREVDKGKTKRKKDGVFYTPKYITKYIVDNTVGRLCAEKKAELQIVEEDYTADKKRNANTKKALDAKLESYRQWLLQITIVDPACGSGAFLNQALDFLIAEHRYIDELRAKLFGYGMVLTDVENSILENNLFGVDINEESVDIAKLSLWLRTAQPRRKLNNLNNNIKCGNSLINDPAVAGAKAFNWQTEFADVFAKGGFDVVIGNPPYVRPRAITDLEKEFYLKNYISANNQFDLYQLFIEKGIAITKNNNYNSFIVPNSFLANESSINLRDFILNNITILEIIDCKQNVFEDASVDVLIYVFEKKIKEKFYSNYIVLSDNNFKIISQFNAADFYQIKNRNFIITLDIHSKNILHKIQKVSKLLSDYFDVTTGVKEYQVGKGLPAQTQEARDNSIFHANYKKDDTYLPEIRGYNLNRYTYSWDNEYISYGKWLAEPRDAKFFKGEKLLIRKIPGIKNLILSVISDDFVVDQSIYIAKPFSKKTDSKYALTLLSSKLTHWYFKLVNNEYDTLFPQIKTKQFKELPIKEIPQPAQQPFIGKADEMLRLNKELQEASGKFTRNLMREFNLANLPGKLQNWHTLSYAEFLKELTKLKVVLSLSQKAEWEDYFTKEQAAAQALAKQIADTDKAIDQMVYALYNLTDEEIKIVEGA